MPQSWYHTCSMMVVLTGENAFALKRSLDQLVSGFVAEHGEIAVEKLNGDEAAFERLQESLQSPPFLAAKKLVVLRAPGANKQFAEAAETLLVAVPDTTDVIIVEPKLDKRSVYYKALKKIADMREAPVLDEPGLARWLAETAKEQGGTLSPADARFLVERVGADQQLVARELDKLLTYDMNVTRESIQLLTELTPQGKIFDLLEVAFAGKLDRVLALYHDQREQKVDPSQIIALLAWQLKILAILKAAGGRDEREIMSTAKLSPYTIQKSQAIARHIRLDQLKAMIARLLALDVRSKRENIDLDEALQNYLITLAR